MSPVVTDRQLRYVGQRVAADLLDLAAENPAFEERLLVYVRDWFPDLAGNLPAQREVAAQLRIQLRYSRTLLLDRLDKLVRNATAQAPPTNGMSIPETVTQS